MKRCMLGIIAVAAVFWGRDSFALDTRRISIPAGHSRSEELGFVPSGFMQHSGTGIVKVTLPQGSSTVLLTAAAGLGTSQIEFPNVSGGEGLMLEIEVVGDLDEVLRSLKRELNGFDELEFSKGKSTIRVRGTISNPADWNKFKQVLNLAEFKDKVESLVQVGVDAATLGTLRKDLKTEGVPLVDPGVKPQDGQVALDYKYGQIVFSGKVFSATELNNLVRVLKSQSWLQIDDGKGKLVETKVPAVVNVAIDDSILELGVAFVKVSKAASKNLGAFTTDNKGNLVATSALAIQGVWDGFYDFLTGKHSHNGADNFRINASLSQTLTALAGNGVARERVYGTIRFHANGDPGKTLHLGGKMTVTPPPSGEGDAPKPQDYEYGFKIINRESRRTASNMAEADVEIEFNGAPEFRNQGGAVVVDQQKKAVHPTVSLPLGQTIAVAGYESLMERTTQPSGTPFLRHIPIVNWFVAGQGESLEDETLLFLVSVRKVDVENEAPMVPNTPQKDVTLDANTPNAERIANEEDMTLKHRGCWTPLNWFRW